jgi:hypothetical protein
MPGEFTLVAQLMSKLDETRQEMARHVGAPVVLTIEGLGYRIVPAWFVESFVKVLSKGTDAEEASPSSSKEQP